MNQQCKVFDADLRVLQLDAPTGDIVDGPTMNEECRIGEVCLGIHNRNGSGWYDMKDLLSGPNDGVCYARHRNWVLPRFLLS